MSLSASGGGGNVTIAATNSSIGLSASGGGGDVRIAATNSSVTASASGGGTRVSVSATRSSVTGSYTNLHESGKTYSGKGSRERSQASGRRVERETGDRHTATDWRPSTSSRDAFKAESRRIDENGVARAGSNHNKIESPGARYRREDGENR